MKNETWVTMAATSKVGLHKQTNMKRPTILLNKAATLEGGPGAEDEDVGEEDVLLGLANEGGRYQDWWA